MTLTTDALLALQGQMVIPESPVIQEMMEEMDIPGRTLLHTMLHKRSAQSVLLDYQDVQDQREDQGVLEDRGMLEGLVLQGEMAMEVVVDLLVIVVHQVLMDSLEDLGNQDVMLLLVEKVLQDVQDPRELLGE